MASTKILKPNSACSSKLSWLSGTIVIRAGSFICPWCPPEASPASRRYWLKSGHHISLHLEPLRNIWDLDIMGPLQTGVNWCWEKSSRIYFLGLWNPCLQLMGTGYPKGQISGDLLQVLLRCECLCPLPHSHVDIVTLKAIISGSPDLWEAIRSWVQSPYEWD